MPAATCQKSHLVVDLAGILLGAEWQGVSLQRDQYLNHTAPLLQRLECLPDNGT